ncbi:acyl-CoA thioester hydrolase [Methylohalomonas lacus]|uniref:Acyl-CoA thioester hydrolase n=2 Tax=Methylohalomonas lacus TaxID=398773 RepID=A0AAE3HN06_9GAMM|nr:tol-pal system-associated acyl-CoA thioesterase [Methylohalomonas lacus]MCS3904186.1 acyl-CoA thioester hydrolase [Methylohalomonas lacus]
MTTEFHWPVRVYYEDTDAGGVVYHANYLRFMERARTEWLRSLGHEQDVLRAEGVIFIVRSAALEYIQPARFNDLLDVSVNIREYRGASVAIKQTIKNEKTGETLCEGNIRIACIDAETLRPRPIPKHLFSELSHVG